MYKMALPIVIASACTGCSEEKPVPDYGWGYYADSSSNTLASLKSAVSEPSANWP